MSVSVKKKGKKSPSQINFKRGLKVGCINVRGIVSNVSKRVELNHWMELNELDIVCIQEWYIPHNKQTVNELLYNDVNIVAKNGMGSIDRNNDNDNVNNVNIELLKNNGNDNNHSDYYNDGRFEQFEGEFKNDSKYSIASLDMAAFPKYEKIEKDTKTLILYRIGLKIVEFDQMEPISDDGLDITWLGIETNRDFMIIGSIYHSPSYKCQYDEVIYQLNHIKTL